MSKIPHDLDGAISLNLCRTAGQWQASLEVTPGAWRIRVGGTAGEALGELFEPVPSDVPVPPPLPY